MKQDLALEGRHVMQDDAMKVKCITISDCIEITTMLMWLRSYMALVNGAYEHLDKLQHTINVAWQIYQPVAIEDKNQLQVYTST
ncbi:hypothetical protein EB796_022750 [Bugula neritina]|uniref:Uncharacterized protein n=1 Tax=Bugula neritina TaxID=10212 RepID=A0A7J7IYE0_BUGNE|nr:hypothetical protein EB796_022750 [Bugula neritina]